MNLEMASRWAESAFRIVAEASLLGAALIAVVALIHWISGKRLRPAWRFALWGIVLVRLLLPIAPESTFSIYNAVGLVAGEKVPPSPVVGEPMTGRFVAEILPMEGVTAEPEQSAIVAKTDISWWRIGSGVWVIGAILLLGRLVLGAGWLRWKVRREGVAREHAILEGAAEELRMRGVPKLVETNVVSSPALFGLLKPVLLVPKGFVEGFSEKELQHVFLHELAHLKRGDLVTNALMAVAQAVHWMNPLVFLAMRQMRMERELACDELVLRAIGRLPAMHASGASAAYGETILRLLEGVPARRGWPGLVGIAEEKRSAHRRISQIAEFEKRPKHWRVMGIAIVLVVAACGLTNAQNRSSRVEPAKPETEVQSPAELLGRVERLMKEARSLIADGELDAAEEILINVRALAPRHQESGQLLKEVNEKQFAAEAAKREARTGRMQPGKGRQEIVRKLQEIRIDRYEVPNGVKLSDIIKDIYATARKFDPDKKGVNFILSSHVENPNLAGITLAVDPATGKAPPKVSDYEVTITPALRDVSLQGLVEAIAEVAIPPEGYGAAPRLRYSIEEYAVVFGLKYAEPEPLYTRTFKIDPNTFTQGLDLRFDATQVAGEDEAGMRSAVNEAVKRYFAAAGIDFGSNQNFAAENDGSPQPQKAFFYNYRTGVLMVRATLRELSIVERQVRTLKARAEGAVQVMISADVMVLNHPGAFKEVFGDEPVNESTSRVLTEPEYRAVQQRAGKRWPIIELPRVTTVAGRSVHLEEEGTILTASYRAADKTFKVGSLEFQNGKAKTYEGLIFDGQTFVMIPEIGKNRDPRRVVFVTVHLVDGAGNRLNATDEFIEQSARAVLPQRP